MRKLFTLIVFGLLSGSTTLFAQLSGGTTYPINGVSNAPTSFATIQEAANYLKTSGVTGTGNVILELQTGYTAASEPGTGITFENITGASATTYVTLRPAAGYSATISASIAGSGILNLRAVKYLTIDGRQGGTGAMGLTFENTSAATTDSTSSLRFVGGTNNVVIRYCTVRGSGKSVTNGGVILFGTGSATEGNNRNTIENCDINGNGSAHNTIAFHGNTTSVALENEGDTIRNCNIHDPFNNGGSTGPSMIRVQQGTTNLVITGNSLYQTSARVYTSQYLTYGIFIGAGTYLSTDYVTITNNYIGGSGPLATGQMTLSAGVIVAGYAGIFMSMGSNSVVTGNTIKNIRVTGNSSAGTFSNSAIYTSLFYSGTINISNNTIDSFQIINNNGPVIASGIHIASQLDTAYVKNITPTFIINNNSIKNITATPSAIGNGQAYGMRIVPTSTSGQGGNLYYNNTVMTISQNTIDGIRTPGSSLSSFAFGIWGSATNGGTSTHFVRLIPTISDNVIKNISSSSSITATGYPVAGGIVILNAHTANSTYTDTLKIKNNTIQNLYGLNVNDIGTAVGGIFINMGRSQVSQNKIFNLYNAGKSSSSSAAAGPHVYGINFFNNGGPGSADNNYISLGDTATNNNTQLGIMQSGNGTFALNLYYNTIILSGSASLKNSACIIRGEPTFVTNSVTPVVLRNNLLVNRRTGSGAHLALAMPGVSSFTSDNNTFITSNAAMVNYYSTSVIDFATWKTNTSNDAYSYYAKSDAATNLSVNPATVLLTDLFSGANYSSEANLDIQSSNAASWLVAGKGLPIASYTFDRAGNARGVANGTPTCIGGNEFVTGTTPPDGVISGNTAIGDSNTVSFAGRELMKIYWVSGTLPGTFTSKYYSGKIHPNFTIGNKGASYYTFAGTGGSNYQYNVKVNYGPHETGSITNSNTNTRITYYSSRWILCPAGSASISTIPQNVVTASLGSTTFPVNSSTAFMLTDNVTPVDGYCRPVATSGCITDFINNVSTTGGTTNISNTVTGCSGSSAYAYYPNQVLTIAQAGTFNFNVRSNGGSDAEYFRIWIDYNQDSEFDASEIVYTSPNSATAAFTGSVVIPCNALTGSTRMRVRAGYENVPATSCGTESYGETEDYAVVILPRPALSNTITSASQNTCYGTAPAILNASIPSGTNASAFTYKWLSSVTDSLTGFSVAAGTSNTQNYSPAALTQTTWFKRVLSCYEDTSAAFKVTVTPQITSNNPQTICNGASYSINGNTYTTAATYRDTLTAANGCDSIVVTQLTVRSLITSNNPQTICNGASYSINGNTYTIADTYRDTLTAANGCDSIVVTQLTVRSLITSNNPQTICNGASYSINGNTYTTAATYSDTLTAASGCDSIVVTQLTVRSLITSNNPQTICNGSSYSINGNTYTIADTYRDTLTATSGCDSIVVTQLTVRPQITSNNPQTICNGGSYSINGNTYTVADTYRDTLTAANGCDSIVVTQLTVRPLITSNNPQTICNGSSYSINGNTYTIADTYSDTLTAANGCDSIVVTQLTVRSLITSNNPQTICNGTSYSINGNTYTIADTYRDTLTAANGCDSIVVTQLTVRPLITSNNPQTICNGASYSINGNTYTVADTYRDTLTAANGCDSIVVTQLTVRSLITSNNPQTICNGASYSINGNTYTVADTYRDTLTAANGCDSIVVTQLTVRPLITSNNPQTICDGSSYSINGNTYTTAATYRDTLTAANGCDSIVVTQLTVRSLITSNNPQTICDGSSYSINGNTYTVAATYRDTLTAANGCDSIIITTLTVNPKPVTSSISGNSTPQINTTENYQVTNTINSTYRWVIINGFQTSGMNTNSITVNWGNSVGAGNVKVVERNGAGCWGDTVSLVTNVLLPVKLISFTGTKINRVVLLDWKTASEVNNDHFEVERSADGQRFERIANVKGNGTTATISAYDYTDKEALNSAEAQHATTLFYRLKQVDTDGKESLSNIVSVRMKQTDASAVALQPNPYSTYANVIIQSANAGNASIMITDMTGRMIATQEATIYEGNNTIALDGMDALKDGVYFITVKQGNDIQTLKLIRQH